MKIREHICKLFDIFCFRLVSIIAGFHISIPPTGSCEGEGIGNFTTDVRRSMSQLGNRTRRKPSARIRKNDLGVEPQRTHKGGGDGGRTDRTYFIGDAGVYNFVRKELQKQGLRYDGSYYPTADAARAGIKIGW